MVRRSSSISSTTGLHWLLPDRGTRGRSNNFRLTPRQIISIPETNIEQAYVGIDPVFKDSRQYISRGLGEEAGGEILLKLEIENPIGSFKGRGVDWLFQNWSSGDRVVTASAGNFGQAMAYCGSNRGVRSDVFSALAASKTKVAAMRHLGATVHLVGDDFDDAKAEALVFAAGNGLPFVEDGKEPKISEGAGTIGLEISRFNRAMDVIYVPLGNGALLSGIGSWFKSHSPTTRIIGVCAERAPSMYLSWQQGKVVETDHADTIADGIACRVPVPESLSPVQSVVDKIVLVSESEIVAAMSALLSTEGLKVEPAGAVSLAAALSHPRHKSGELAATIVTGRNIDDSVYDSLVRSSS